MNIAELKAAYASRQRARLARMVNIELGRLGEAAINPARKLVERPHVNPDYLRIPDMAEKYALALSTMQTSWRKRVKAGELPAPRLMNPPRWHVEDVATFRPGANRPEPKAREARASSSLLGAMISGRV